MFGFMTRELAPLSDKYRLIFCIIAFAIVLYVYTLTLAPTVYFIDSGELSAVASTLGIAHPTGYPLFTLIGYLFTKLPVSSSEVYKLNLMSALFCAVSIFIFFFLINFLLEQRRLALSPL
ncbi:MAG: protein O-mannosyl-transferase family, partial [Ignavibacteria bacterium]